ncbi:MAG: VanZ family protein [Pirellulales bacterium]
MPSTALTPHGRSPAERRTRTALFFYAMALFMATHWPHPPQVIDVPGIDKLEHLIAYAGLGLLLARHFFFQWQHPLHVLALSIGVVGLFAALDELLQIPVGRQCDWRDWLADLSGAILGWGTVSVVVVTRRRLKTAAPRPESET